MIVDPGDEADRLLHAIDALGVTLDAILLTHALRPRRRRCAGCAGDGGAGLLPGDRGAGARRHHALLFHGRDSALYESYDADETVAGGERLDLAGFEIDVIFTPGHSPRHVTYSIADEQAIFSGDVLFQGSVGRTDLPGGD